MNGEFPRSSSIPFENYKAVQKAVMKMQSYAGAKPSKYWQEELENFDYMLDANEIIINKLRRHCFHITGVYPYEYRTNQNSKRELFKGKLTMLQGIDDVGLKITEPEILGGFGHKIDGSLYNLDTLKYYESLIALHKAGLPKHLTHPNGMQTIVEIGGGWGGLAYQFKRLFPNTQYVIVDFPELFHFSATYLLSAFPGSQYCFFDDENCNNLQSRTYDFVFIPHFTVPETKVPKPTLGINTVSFQEMTTEQVSTYCRWLSENGCDFLYSLNRERSKYNEEISSVSEIISHYYEPRRIPMLDMEYTQLRNEKTLSLTAKKLLKKALGRDHGVVNGYKHLFCSRKVFP